MIKTMKCDLCEVTAAGETFKDWMMALMPHYMEAHADAMKGGDDAAERRDKWMAENQARFENA